MGKGFGELGVKIRNVVYYKISPFETRAFAGAISNGVPNTFRRIAENFWIVVPPFVASYLIYTIVEKKHEKLMRKNPEDFACDV